MDPFDWTSDKNIYQRWQLWSHKARLALDAMEGDNEEDQDLILTSLVGWQRYLQDQGMEDSKALITRQSMTH